jgi:hypothetical protein
LSAAVASPDRDLLGPPVTRPAPVPRLKTGRLPAVEIFAAGTHRDRNYTLADLDAMVRNFAANRGLVDPPAVVGHEEDQPLSQDDPLNNTGSPAVGWVSRLWRSGAKLFAEIVGVPARFAELINARLYRKVSAEVYDDARDVAGARGSGCMLRRVAFLGGELPQIKSLADLPLVRMGGPDAPFHRHFAEVKPMDRAALEEQLKGLGWSEATVGMVSAAFKDDGEFAAFVNQVLAEKAGALPAGDAPAGNADPPPAPDAETMIADLVALGEDENALRAMSPDDLYQLWLEKKGAAMSEPKPTTPPPPATPPGVPGGTPAPTPAPAPQPTPQAVAAQFAELDRMVRQRFAAEKREQIDRFCEEMVEKNVLLPAHTEKTVDPATGKPRGFARRMLEAADAVRKFADRPSDLETLMADMRKAPRVHDPAERVKAGRPGGQDAAARKFAEAREQAAKARPPAQAGKTLEERLRLLPRK